MAFNFKNFYQFVYYSFIKQKRTHHHLSLKRILVLSVFFPVYILLEICVWISLGLDQLIFPNFKKQKTEQPVFIIGNPRSGTTFLYQTMARDEKRFSFFRTWEIVLSPSIIQRKFYWLLAAGFKRLTFLFPNLSKILKKISIGNERMHKIDPFAPEEDGYTLMHIFATIGLWAYSVPFEIMQKYIYFDEQLPDFEKKSIMDFYEGIIRRHLFAYGGNKQLLSKTPFFTPKITSLVKKFPDARFIYLVRNPLEMIPSQISLMTYCWKTLAGISQKYIFQEETISMARYWYQYAFKALAELSDEQVFIVQYDCLHEDPAKCIQSIYKHFGYEINTEFKNILVKETENAQSYKSRHRYSLREMGLSKRRILKEFQEVFLKFDFKVSSERQKEVLIEKAIGRNALSKKLHLRKRILQQIPWRKKRKRYTQGLQYPVM
ncbi:MAG: sulfotransferase [Anaerolineaceae bacterium]|nr:sulfotransferase [Anaerolineaceae bacterium]